MRSVRRTADAAEIDRIFDAGLPPAEAATAFRRILARSTNLAVCDADPFGDGDQTPCRTQALRQSLLDLWGCSADWNYLTMSSGHEDTAESLRATITGMRVCTPFFLDCFWGDAPRVRAAIEAARRTARPSALSQLLERRELVLRMTPLQAATTGTRLMPPSSQHEGVLPPSVVRAADHCAVAEALLAAGARVDARDVGGYTALHHATSHVGNAVSLRLAGVLLRHGAPVDTKTRNGCTPLFDPVMAGKVPSVRLLLEAGADPGVRDADGTFPYALMDAHAGLKELVTQSSARGRLGAGRTLEGSRAVLQGLSRADLNGAAVSVGAYDAEADRYSVTLPSAAVVAVKRINVVAESAQAAAAAATAGALKPPRCGICDEPSAFVCGGCIGVGYCGEEHRRAAWRAGHRAECRAYAAAHVVGLPLAALLPPGELARACDRSHSLEDLARLWARPDMAAFFEGGVAPGETPEDPEETAEEDGGAAGAARRAAPFFVVKVQLPPRDLLRGPGEPAWDLLLSDEARSIEFRVPRELPAAERLAGVAAARGIARSKVFLRAVRTERAIAIDTNTVLPAMAW